MRILEESLLDKGYDYVKNLEQQYATAIQDIESQIARWYQRFAAENGITLAEANKLLTTQELDEFRWTVEEYIKHGQENAVSQAWLKQLKNASARVHVSRLDSLKLQLQEQAEVLHGAQTEALNSSLSEVYQRGYYHTAFELQKGMGVGWTLHGLTDEAISKVLSRPWTLDSQTFSDRIWANKQALVNSVNTQLTQMIMRGAAPDKAIKAISDRFQVSKSQAGRLVMTESAAFANEARKDCFKDLGVEKYVIVETLDNEICGLCAQLDGKVYPISEAVNETAEPEVNHNEPMKMSDVVTKLESLFDILNRVYFDNALPKPVITVQSTPKAYGHCSTKKIWKSESDGQYEINIGAEFLNRPSANTAATMCHEMVHLYCLVNEIQDTCQKGRYHNKTFKAEAEARDLEIGYDRTVGFSHTNPTEAFKKTLEDNGFVLEVPFARVMPEEKAKAEREKPHRYVCPVCGQEVKTTADLSLICGICEVAMERAD